MNSRLRTTSLLALFFLVAAPVFSIIMGYDGAVVVMSVIIVIGFFTVIFVGVIGSLEEDNHPQSANDSAAVNAWKARLGEGNDAPEASEAAQ